MRPQKFLIVTTVPETLATILKHQPGFLAKSFGGATAVELVTSPGPVCVEITETEGVPVHNVRMARGIAPLKDFLSVLSMIRLMLRVKPDIVHSYTEKAGMIAMLAAWLCRVPIRIHTFTGLVFPTQTGLKRQLLIWIDRLICACASQVVPEGLGVKNDLQQFGITRKPLNMIGHGNIAGVDTAYFDRHAEGVEAQSRSLAGQLQLSGHEFIFCFVGRLNRDKGILELLEAFETLPAHARLVLIGALDVSAPISKHEQRIIERHERIHALGFLSDIRPVLHLADAFVLPSYREGFPNTVLQAGAMELPVIATDINGCNEVIEPGMNGWLVPPRSARALNEAMRAALEAPPATLVQMGVHGRQRVIQRFERTQHWRNLMTFYNETLSPLRERTS